jgi:hypothetical protein
LDAGFIEREGRGKSQGKTRGSQFLDKAGLLDIIQPNKIHKNFDKD